MLETIDICVCIKYFSPNFSIIPEKGGFFLALKPEKADAISGEVDDNEEEEE